MTDITISRAHGVLSWSSPALTVLALAPIVILTLVTGYIWTPVVQIGNAMFGDVWLVRNQWSKPEVGQVYAMSHVISLLDSERPLLTTMIVGGVAGDAIEIKDDNVYVAGTRIGNVSPATDDGKRLRPIESQTIPHGYVFVYGDNPVSYDSRYAEFGLVNVAQLRGRAYKVF